MLSSYPEISVFDSCSSQPGYTKQSSGKLFKNADLSTHSHTKTPQTFFQGLFLILDFLWFENEMPMCSFLAFILAWCSLRSVVWCLTITQGIFTHYCLKYFFCSFVSSDGIAVTCMLYLLQFYHPWISCSSFFFFSVFILFAFWFLWTLLIYCPVY